MVQFCCAKLAVLKCALHTLQHEALSEAHADARKVVGLLALACQLLAHCARHQLLLLLPLLLHAPEVAHDLCTGALEYLRGRAVCADLSWSRAQADCGARWCTPCVCL